MKVLLLSLLVSLPAFSAEFKSPEKIEFKSGKYMHLLELTKRDFGLLTHQDCKGRAEYYPVLNNYGYSNMWSHAWMEGGDELRFRLSMIKLDEVDHYYNVLKFKSAEACRNSMFSMTDLEGVQISMVKRYDWGRVPEAPYLWVLSWNLDSGFVTLKKFTDSGKLITRDTGYVVKWHQ